MELEVADLKAKMLFPQVLEKANMRFYVGRMGSADVVVVKSGIGKVNAALCVQILVDDFCVSHIINTGIAGSLDSSLDIGDILISRDAAYHDMDATAFGYALGEIPQMEVIYFPADEALATLAQQACTWVNPGIQAKLGRIVSGDQFIADTAIKERIIKNFRAQAVEMEGAAIAHSAYLNHVPFIIIRSISDKADGSAHMDYPEFEKKAAGHSAALVEALVEIIE